MGTVVVAFHSGFLDRSVHAFDLSIRPGGFRFCQPVFNAVLMAALAAVIRQDRVYCIRDGLDQIAQKGRGDVPI